MNREVIGVVQPNRFVINVNLCDDDIDLTVMPPVGAMNQAAFFVDRALWRRSRGTWFQGCPAVVAEAPPPFAHRVGVEGEVPGNLLEGCSGQVAFDDLDSGGVVGVSHGFC